MRIRFVRDYPGYPAGTTADVSDGNHLAPGVAEQLVRRGIAEVIQEKAPSKPRPRRKKG